MDSTAMEQTASKIKKDRSFSCDLCGNSYRRNYDLQCHIKTKHLPEPTLFKCHLCGRTFNRKSNMTRHLLVHSTNTEHLSYKCDECGKLFLQECDLRRHVAIHDGTQPYKCTLCGRGYVRKTDLDNHLRFHRKEKPFRCHLCARRFTMKGDLNRHVRLVHERSKLLFCGYCNLSYANDITLMRHMQYNHFEELSSQLQSSSRVDLTCQKGKECPVSSSFSRESNVTSAQKPIVFMVQRPSNTAKLKKTFSVRLSHRKKEIAEANGHKAREAAARSTLYFRPKAGSSFKKLVIVSKIIDKASESILYHFALTDPEQENDFLLEELLSSTGKQAAQVERTVMDRAQLVPCSEKVVSITPEKSVFEQQPSPQTILTSPHRKYALALSTLQEILSCRTHEMQMSNTEEKFTASSSFIDASSADHDPGISFDSTDALIEQASSYQAMDTQNNSCIIQSDDTSDSCSLIPTNLTSPAQGNFTISPEQSSDFDDIEQVLGVEPRLLFSPVSMLIGDDQTCFDDNSIEASLTCALNLLEQMNSSTEEADLLK